MIALTGIVAVARWAFSKQGLTVIAVVAAISLLGWLLWRAYSAGTEHGAGTIVKQINRDNENAANSAEKGRDSYRRCVGAGRVYDYEHGTCHD